MRGTVLVVEDDATLTHAIVRNLEARGFAATSVATVADALDSVRAGSPALVILDIDLPDGSGWDVLRDLRSRDDTHVPVIVISALRPNQRLADDLRCFGVLEKPFPMASLMRLVESQLGGTIGAHPSGAM